jgi:hypothetical protein
LNYSQLPVIRAIEEQQGTEACLSFDMDGRKLQDHGRMVGNILRIEKPNEKRPVFCAVGKIFLLSFSIFVLRLHPKPAAQAAASGLIF